MNLFARFLAWIGSLTRVSKVGPAKANDQDFPLHVQRVKIVLGAVGVDDGDLSSTNPLPIAASAASAAVGATPFALASTNSTVPQSVKNTPGQLYGGYVYNAATSVRYLKIFDAAAPPTMGSTSAAYELPIPPSAGGNLIVTAVGVVFSNGIQIAVTSASGLTDNTSTGLAASDLVGVLYYK